METGKGEGNGAGGGELTPREHHVDTRTRGKHRATRWTCIIALNAHTEENKPPAPIY